MKRSAVTRVRYNRTSLKKGKIDKARYDYRLRNMGVTCGIEDIIQLLASDIENEDIKVIIDGYLKHQHMTVRELEVKIIKYFAEELAQKWSDNERVKNEQSSNN